MPTAQPVEIPTSQPTKSPTSQATASPTIAPTAIMPTAQPTATPASAPTNQPTTTPTTQPTFAPTTAQPTALPTSRPTARPTFIPTTQPTPVPQITRKNLVVMMRFSDHTSRVLPSQSDIAVLMNGSSGNTVSVKHVFLDSSSGILNIDSTILAWVTLPNTEAYYSAGSYGTTSTIHEAIKSALDFVDQSVNFLDFDQDRNGKIDAIAILHSGYGAEWGGTGNNLRIWSHKWSLRLLNSGAGWISSEGVKVYDYHISTALWGTSGSVITSINTIAHETGKCSSSHCSCRLPATSISRRRHE
jgi:hypothetical protein